MSNYLTILVLMLAQSGAGESAAKDDAKAAPESESKKPLVEVAPIHEQPMSEEETQASYLVGVLVHTPLNVRFDQTPARDAFVAIAEAIDLPIVVRYASESGPVGTDPDLPLTIEFQGRKALSVLERIIDLTAGTEDSTWQIRSGYVEIGPKSLLSAPAARTSRVYDIADLLLEPSYFANAPLPGLTGVGLNSRRVQWDLSNLVIIDGQATDLSRPEDIRPHRIVRDRPQPGFVDRKSPELIVEELITMIVGTVEPKAWDVNGGETATIRYFQHGLIINAPDYIHRQVGGYPMPMSPKQIAEIRATRAGAESNAEQSPAQDSKIKSR